MPVYTGNMSMTILILKSFVDTIPRELDDSAFMDGCGKFQVFHHIILPLMKPGLAACTIITFVNVWNAFIVPMTFIFKDCLRSSWSFSAKQQQKEKTTCLRLN